MEQDYIERIIETEQRCKSNTHRLDAVEKNQTALQDMAASVKVLAVEQKHANAQIDGMSKKVDALERKPGERWNNLGTTAIAAVATGIIGYLLAALL